MADESDDDRSLTGEDGVEQKADPENGRPLSSLQSRAREVVDKKWESFFLCLEDGVKAKHMPTAKFVIDLATLLEKLVGAVEGGESLVERLNSVAGKLILEVEGQGIRDKD